MRTRLSCSGRWVCRWLGCNRSTMPYRPKPLPPKKRLIEAQIVKVSKEHPTLGYKKVTGLMNSMGYQVNSKLVQRSDLRKRTPGSASKAASAPSGALRGPCARGRTSQSGLLLGLHR